MWPPHAMHGPITAKTDSVYTTKLLGTVRSEIYVETILFGVGVTTIGSNALGTWEKQARSQRFTFMQSLVFKSCLVGDKSRLAESSFELLCLPLSVLPSTSTIYRP